MILFWRGLILGLAIAAPVGPIGVLCIRQTLTYGWLTGLVTGLGAATADAIYGSIAGLGLTLISALLVSQEVWLRLIGGLFLGYLGVKTFLSRTPTEQTHSVCDRHLLRTYGTTLLLTLTNPATIFSFLAIFAGLGLVETGGSRWSALSLVIGVFIGSALWWLTLSSGTTLFRQRLTSHHLRWVNRVSGVMITAFGLLALLSLAS